MERTEAARASARQRSVRRLRRRTPKNVLAAERDRHDKAPWRPTGPPGTTVAGRALGREWAQKPALDGNAPEGVGAFAPSVPWGDGRRSVRGSFGAPRSRA